MELSKSQISKDIHFIKIDKRIKDNGKTFVILENGQRIILPDPVNRVPCLLRMNDFQFIFGDDIRANLQSVQTQITKVATQNNLEPVSYTLGGGGVGGIVSDTYSFLDMDDTALSATGNGGTRQLHSYATINDNFSIHTEEDSGIKVEKGGLTLEQLQKQREEFR
jgi:hypothetical protein